MDIYHIWFDLKPGTGDLEFSKRLDRYLGMLKERGALESFRLTRRKLGLGPRELGEFHIAIETRDLAQLDSAFQTVSTRTDPVETAHFDVNSLVANAQFALYRDFPDPQRQTGQERF